MFTTDERENILRELTVSLSDIDIALVHNGEVSVEELFRKTLERVERVHKTATVLNQYPRNLQVILLENYLEIDIGYYTLDTLTARREHYKTVYDSTGAIDAILESTWQKNSVSNMGTTQSVNIESELERTDGNLWYNIFHTVISFKRKEIYRCYFELEELRRNLISLSGKRQNIESKRYRDVSRMRKEELLRLEPLFRYPESCSELKEMLLQILSLYYEEFAYWNRKTRVTSDFLCRYVSENLSQKG